MKEKIETKKCSRCKEFRPYDRFYKNKARYDGHQNHCKDCWRILERERRERYPKAYKEKAKRYYEKHKKKQIPEGMTSWRKENKHKTSTHTLVRKAIKDGVLVKELCFCGEKSEAHHEDYNKPLDVIWLCRRHHKRLHADEKYD